MTNPPAFPRSAAPTDTPWYPCQEGMTLRDYFAAKAMQGMCANSELTSENWPGIVRNAYNAADAMLAEREATGKAEGVAA